MSAPYRLTEGADEAALRVAIGSAAKDHKPANRKGWFKRVDLAEKLGVIVLAHWAELADSDLRAKLEAVQLWAGSDG